MAKVSHVVAERQEMIDYRQEKVDYVGVICACSIKLNINYIFLENKIKALNKELN